MNSEQLRQLLSDTVVSVFEEAVYALIDREQEYCSGETPAVESVVPFSGTYTGTLALTAEASGSALLTGNFLGSDSDSIPPDLNHEVIGELSNIIAGRLLEAWQPEATNYDIGIPTVKLVPHSQSRLMTEPQVCVVKLRTDAGLHVAAAVLLGVWP